MLWISTLRDIWRRAKIVVEETVSNRRSPDGVVYPIGFLYRHDPKLRLKTIIDQGKKLLNRRPGFPEDHDLDLLWNIARKIIEEIYSKDPKETLESVDESMVEFCNLDQQSIAFRYLFDKSGKRSLAQLKLLNVRRLGEVMERISTFLESVSQGIVENLRIMQENQEHG
jgi:hypothetical protein